MTSVAYRRRISGSTVIRSTKKHSEITEILRFSMAWSAMNALFARDSILRVIGSPSRDSEIERFRFTYRHAGLDQG